MTDADPAPWPHGAADAIGQTGEFLVWASLIGQSRGGLHVFLPMLDRGIDGLVHRLADGAYLALQVKTKTSVKSSEGPIAVYENHLFTDDQLIIGVSLEGDRLGPYVLVADGATYRRKAARIVDRGLPHGRNLDRQVRVAVHHREAVFEQPGIACDPQRTPCAPETLAFIGVFHADPPPTPVRDEVAHL